MVKSAGTPLGKGLAILGMALIWFPIFFTLLTSAVGSIRSRAFHLDYLMPAELFPAALVGALLIVWTALRARERRMPVTVSAAAMVLFFACVLLIPVVTGLASGQAAPEGWPWALTILSLALYTAAMILTGVLGALVVRDLFRKARP